MRLYKMHTCHQPVSRFFIKPALLLAFLFAFIPAACAITSVDRQENPRIASYAIKQDDTTALGAAMMQEAAAHKGMSGFRLLDNARQSLAMRLAMVEAAEKTLDLQYYIIHNDMASNLMLEALLRAAERGVRVRFLIDGITFSEVDNDLAILNNQPNISIRVFNPLVKPKIPLLAKFRLGFLDTDQFHKRMHNKALITDNQLAVTGGRNLGDEYFDENPDTNFKDLDVIAAGPITDRISKSFDKYWNDENAFLIADLHPKPSDPEEMAALRRDMKEQWAQKMDATGDTLKMERLADVLKSGDLHLIWAKAELSVDVPEKVDVDATEAESESRPLSRMISLLEQSETEFLAVTPYFVPTDAGVDILTGLVDRGMRVKIVTNSLASTDVVAVHTGYRRYREDVIRGGVEMYEYKPIGGQRPKQRLAGASAPPTASLHSKAYVIDGYHVVLGSYNLDPRSTELNTELALIIHSPVIAAQVTKLFNDATSPKQSYHVQLVDDELIWVTQENGQEKIYKTEPNAGIWRRVEAGFMSLLPIEDQL